MKKKRIVTLLIVAIMILGFFSQTLAINLMVTEERPHSADKGAGDEIIGDDIYRFLRRSW